MSELLTIGRVARLSGLTTKALRHYDSTGVLRPAEVDEDNGYRRYTREQVEDARKIRILRDLDVPLDEIRRILAGDDVQGRLGAHRRRVNAQLARLQTIHLSLSKLIDAKEIERMVRRPETAPGLEHDAQRALAVDLFNYTWTLMERENRSQHDDDLMVHSAHACRYLWDAIGAPENHARGEWQISRVYATLGRGEPAIHHAKRCLEICEEHGIGDWDLAYAYEALARAHAVAGDGDASARYAAQARDAGERIAETDDRELFDQDMATIPV